jgi:xanthine/uracil permease
VARIAFASTLAGLVAFATHAALAGALAPEAPRRSLAALLAAFLAAGVVYALASRLLGIEEWRELMSRVTRRLKR